MLLRSVVPAAAACAPEYRALVLRGGDAVTHNVAAALISNTAALVLFGLISGWLSNMRSRRRADGRACGALEAAVINCIGGALAYLLTYMLSGFVPMGFVAGSRPIVAAFTPALD